MIAVPDFEAGAMENWGLIVYRESFLLFDPLMSSARDKIQIAEVVVHELAHQVNSLSHICYGHVPLLNCLVSQACNEQP